jgi:hypothetical protein
MNAKARMKIRAFVVPGQKVVQGTGPGQGEEILRRFV